jgi:hypothetical protein
VREGRGGTGIYIISIYLLPIYKGNKKNKCERDGAER